MLLISCNDDSFNSLSVGLLSCSEARRLWVSWESGTLVLAVGGLAGQRMIDWQDPSPLPADAVALSTSWGATGRWMFSRQTGQLLHHVTSVLYTFYVLSC